MPEPQYAERSMVVYINHIYTRGKPREILNPMNIDGENVVDVFLGHCVQQIGKIQRLGPRIGTSTFWNVTDVTTVC